MSRRRLAFVSLILGLACSRNAQESAPPPEPRWVDIGRPCTPDSAAFALPESLRDTSAHPFGLGDVREQKAAHARTIPRRSAHTRFTYDELYDWFRYIHMNIRGVRTTAWALDESKNRIFYAVEDEAAERHLTTQLTKLRVPCFLVAVDIWGRAHF